MILYFDPFHPRTAVLVFQSRKIMTNEEREMNIKRKAFHSLTVLNFRESTKLDTDNPRKTH
jgi:hypothetical protein